MKVSLNYKVDSRMQSVGELWESIANLAHGRVLDNIIEDYYPIDVRELQLESLAYFVEALKEAHEKIRKEDRDHE